MSSGSAEAVIDAAGEKLPRCEIRRDSNQELMNTDYIVNTIIYYC